MKNIFKIFLVIVSILTVVAASYNKNKHTKNLEDIFQNKLLLEIIS